MNLDKLDTICAAAIQQAYDVKEDSTNLCVILNLDSWKLARNYLRASYLFDMGYGSNLNVFFYRGVYVSWSPLIASPQGWAVGKMYSAL